MPFISPQTDAIRAALEETDRPLLHCLNCGGQVVTAEHDGRCHICGSRAVLIEQTD